LSVRAGFPVSGRSTGARISARSERFLPVVAKISDRFAALIKKKRTFIFSGV
jgi:hypothetical protein